MRRLRHALVAIIAAAALAAGGTAAAGGTSVVASASGASFVTIEDFFGLQLIDVGPFTFNAQVHADGSVHGRYNYRSSEDGTPFNVQGSITCAVIRANRAWLGGIVEKSTPESYEGQEMWFQGRRPRRAGSRRNARHDHVGGRLRSPGLGAGLLRPCSRAAVPVVHRTGEHPGSRLTSFAGGAPTTRVVPAPLAASGSVPARRHAAMALEHPGEVALVAETGVGGDRGDGSVGLD